MGKIVSLLLGTVKGEFISAAVALMALLAWFAWDQRTVGANNERATYEAAGRELANAGLEARRAADMPGAARRLLQHSCRDC